MISLCSLSRRAQLLRRLRSHCCLAELPENHRPRNLLKNIILSKPTKNLKTDVRITGLLGFFCSRGHCCIYRGQRELKSGPRQGCDNPSLRGTKHLRFVAEGWRSCLPKQGVTSCSLEKVGSWAGKRTHWRQIFAIGSGADSGSPIRSTKLHQNISNTAWVLFPFHSDFLILFQVVLFVWIILGGFFIFSNFFNSV